MKKGRGKLGNWTSLAWALVGVLLLAAMLISLGKRETATQPTIDNYGPSGTAAFAQLLRSSGYVVSAEQSNSPRFRSGDLVIGFVNEEGFAQEEQAIFRTLASHVKDGGTALLLEAGSNFRDESLAATDGQVSSVLEPQKRLPVRFRTYLVPGQMPIGKEEVSTALFRGGTPQIDLVRAGRMGKGLFAQVTDGLIATNRLLDKQSNASVLLSTVKTLAKPGSQIVFAEATFNPQDPTLLEVLGTWSEGAWWQILFLFVVVVYTLGKRFGLPEEERPAQMGQRELVDAIADTYRRARATSTACNAVRQRSDGEVRKALKLAKDAPVAERDLRIPEELAYAFKRIDQVAASPSKPAEAFAACKVLKQQVRAFLGRN